MSLYLSKDRLEGVEKLLKDYPDDVGASWEYGKALYLFKKLGPNSIETAKQLNEARKVNRFVAEFITGKKKLPKTIPDTYSIGSKEEALIYVSEGFVAWKTTPGAIKWLAEWT